MAAENSGHRFRLEGFEPDNVLAFLALLGVMRALEVLRDEPEFEGLRPRASWDLEPPVRPVLSVGSAMTPGELVDLIDRGIRRVAESHDFTGRRNLDYGQAECREALTSAALSARVGERAGVDLLTALMTDAAVREKKDAVQPTPLCLQFGQGHQFFLKRLAEVPAVGAPPARGRGRSKVEIGAGECLSQALFQPWHRMDPTDGFRWDPDETARYAQMPGNPTDGAYKLGTQHGANRLAAIGIAELSLAPTRRGGRVRVVLAGGSVGRGFSLAWPVWQGPASLAAIRNLLAHPQLRAPGGLNYLGVMHVHVADRISVGKFMNFARARLLPGIAPKHEPVPKRRR